tara:strand:- start:170 stop:451 length:282 start_codon:yes stop_codon:yes gene_type:complete
MKDFIAYYKNFLGDDKYWIDDFLNNKILRKFLERHQQNPDTLDAKYLMQKDLGVQNKADYLMTEFIRSDLFKDAPIDDINKELFIYKLTRRLQ